MAKAWDPLTEKHAPEDLRPLDVQARLYRRPHGSSQVDYLMIPGEYSVERMQILDVWQYLGIELTFEVMAGNTVNLCLDDGDFDYKFELVPNGPELHAKVIELIDGFDYNDYMSMKEEQE